MNNCYKKFGYYLSQRHIEMNRNVLSKLPLYAYTDIWSYFFQNVHSCYLLESFGTHESKCRMKMQSCIPFFSTSVEFICSVLVSLVVEGCQLVPCLVCRIPEIISPVSLFNDEFFYRENFCNKSWNWSYR